MSRRETLTPDYNPLANNPSSSSHILHINTTTGPKKGQNKVVQLLFTEARSYNNFAKTQHHHYLGTSRPVQNIDNKY